MMTAEQNKRQILIFWLLLILFLGSVVFGASSVYDDDFESYSLGELDGQGTWNEPTGVFKVSGANPHNGSKSILVASSTVSTASTTVTANSEGSVSFYIYNLKGSYACYSNLYFYLFRDTVPATPIININFDYNDANSCKLVNQDTLTTLDTMTVNAYHKIDIEWWASTTDLLWYVQVDDGGWSAVQTKVGGTATQVSDLAFRYQYGSYTTTYYIDDISSPTLEWTLTASITPTYPEAGTTTVADGIFNATGEYEWSVTGEDTDEYEVESMSIRFDDATTGNRYIDSYSIASATGTTATGTYSIPFCLPDGEYDVSYYVNYSYSVGYGISEGMFLDPSYSTYDIYSQSVAVATTTVSITDSDCTASWEDIYPDISPTSTAQETSFFRNLIQQILQVFNRVPISYFSVFINWFNDLEFSEATSTVMLDLSAVVGTTTEVQAIDFSTLGDVAFSYGGSSGSWNSFFRTISTFVLLLSVVYLGKWWLKWIFD